MPKDLLMKWACLPEGSSFKVEFPETSKVDGHHLTGIWEIIKLPGEYLLVHFDKACPSLVIPHPRECAIQAVARSKACPYSYYLTSGDVLDILEWIENGKPIPPKRIETAE
jgi:hypothetical protein